VPARANLQPREAYVSQQNRVGSLARRRVGRKSSRMSQAKFGLIFALVWRLQA
jgi:hypothetical protein